MLNFIWVPNTTLKFRKTNDPIPSKRLDRWMKGWMDQQKNPI